MQVGLRGLMRGALQRLLRALMLFSLATLAFIYGFLCHEYRWFPFHHLRNAQIASQAIAEVAQLPTPRMPDAHGSRSTSQPSLGMLPLHRRLTSW